MASLLVDVVVAIWLFGAFALLWQPMRVYMRYWQEYSTTRYGYKIALYNDLANKKKITIEKVENPKPIVDMSGDFQRDTKIVEMKAEE